MFSKGKIKSMQVRANDEVSVIKKKWDKHYNFTPLIVDVGANIGLYTKSFLDKFTKSKVVSYEPNPNAFKEIKNSDRLTKFCYGLFDENVETMIGMQHRKDDNIGTYSIYHSKNPLLITLKNANDEPFRPNIVKIDIEGAEQNLLNCTEFFSECKLILIEQNPMYKDTSEQLKQMGFKKLKNTSKLNELWRKK